MNSRFNHKLILQAQKYLLRSAVLLALFVGLGGCSNNNSGSNNPMGQDSSNVVVSVKVDSIRKETLDVIVNAYGITSARQVYKVISPVTGVITKFNYYSGDNVPTGETIATVIPKESYSAIKGAETMLNDAINERQKSEAERTLKLAEENSNQIKITAPFTGVLVDRIKNENEVVNEGELIASIINKSSIYFIAQVPADSINRIITGQRVVLTFPTIRGKKFEGTVKNIEPRVNMQSQTFPVHVKISNSPQLLADSLFGEAAIIIGKHRDVFVAPQKAVIHNEEKDTYSVTLINPDSIAYTVNVTPGIRRESVVEIHSGKIKAGMPVIIEGNYGLPDSTRVSVKK
jgi:multidrug efflux pump subunit AcrA (membrane-fusion protein)